MFFYTLTLMPKLKLARYNAFALIFHKLHICCLTGDVVLNNLYVRENVLVCKFSG